MKEYYLNIKWDINKIEFDFMLLLILKGLCILNICCFFYKLPIFFGSSIQSIVYLKSFFFDNAIYLSLLLILLFTIYSIHRLIQYIIELQKTLNDMKSMIKELYDACELKSN